VLPGVRNSSSRIGSFAKPAITPPGKIGFKALLQDFELGRRTEIDFINGYVVQLGTQIGIPIAMNAAIAEMVHKIEQGQIQPLTARLDDLLRRVKRNGGCAGRTGQVLGLR
jgi:hypothetical protein